MSQNRAMVSAFRLQKSISHPYHLMRTSRVGVVNRYQYDYACEDEYFQKDMTLYEARMLPLPLPKDFQHATHPDHEVWPAHWNDVRFNFKPMNQDRRVYIHDNYMNAYDFQHDFAHTTGFVDEDLDYELPDPGSAMHFKKKRSAPVAFLGVFASIAVLFGYPILGLKIPQKDNPFYYRKKYASPSTIHQFQRMAIMEYGQQVPMGPDTNTAITSRGFEQVGNGLRYDLDCYEDLIS